VEEHGLRIIEKPTLRQPNMLCGIDGWVDGGEASTGTVAYLIRKLGAIKFAELPAARFHVFQIPGYNASRPKIKSQDGLVLEHHFPTNEFFYWRNPHSERDLVLLLGTEPNLHWEEYIETLFGLAEELGVRRIYLPGGVLDSTPHTREPNVFCTVSLPPLKEEMANYAVQFSGYEGPGSLASSIVYLGGQRGLEVVSLTARATFYPEFSLSIPHNPKVIRALIKRLDALLDLRLDISDLNLAAEELERKMTAATRQNPRFRSYLAALEKDYHEVDYLPPLGITEEEALRLAEDLLRRSREQGTPPGENDSESA